MSDASPAVIALKDQSVLILGLGASGLAMARWCVRQGAQVTVADTRQNPPGLAALQRELAQVVFACGAFDSRLLEVKNYTAVFKSPGLSPSDVAPICIADYSYLTGTFGELDLFADALTDLKATQAYAPQVLAVTGTNGKTTVTSLTGQLIERAGKTVAVAGNIGPTLLETLIQCLDANTLPQVWVIELSSFQLDGLRRGDGPSAPNADAFQPTAATVLNITQDHLDWHGSMQAYTAAKAKVFGASTLMVLNREDPQVMAMLPAAVVTGRVRDRVARDYLSFGGDLPARPGDFGIEEVNGMVWLVRAHEADETKRRRSEAADEVYIQRLMPADALRIRGRHNAVNALAALALATAAGCSLAPLLHGLREYRGEPHRVQSAAILNGVEFFDDSKGTNVGATVAALNGLGAERKVIVILGGEGKGQDFAPLAAPVARFVRCAVLIGRDAGLIRAAIQSTGVPLLDAGTMQEAVALANTRAHAGDAVLMSPACASFDMFDNYPHRARVFLEAVAALAGDMGLEVQGSA